MERTYWGCVVALVLLKVSTIDAQGIGEDVYRFVACSNESLQITCHDDLSSLMAFHQAYFTLQPVSDKPGCSPHGNYTRSSREVRRAVNRRCSGRNTCNFQLSEDMPESRNWDPGTLVFEYGCMREPNITQFCNRRTVGDYGYIMNPGYPNYYVGDQVCTWTVTANSGQTIKLQVLDVDIRGTDDFQPTCRDRLEVWEESNQLLGVCGEKESLIQLESQGEELNVSLISYTKNMYPTRGLLLWYQYLGCPTPAPPKDGYLVHRNISYAEFMCCVDYVFPDVIQRRKVLRCVNGLQWNDTLTDCVSIAELMMTGNETVQELLLALNQTTDGLVEEDLKQPDFIMDIVLPSTIMVGLFLINAVILTTIILVRRRNQHKKDEFVVEEKPPVGVQQTIQGPEETTEDKSGEVTSV